MVAKNRSVFTGICLLVTMNDYEVLDTIVSIDHKRLFKLSLIYIYKPSTFKCWAQVRGGGGGFIR